MSRDSKETRKDYLSYQQNIKTQSFTTIMICKWQETGTNTELKKSSQEILFEINEWKM